MRLSSRGAGLLLVSPALAVIAVFFIVPLGLSVQSAFTAKDGGLTLAHFEKSFELYTTDMLFTLGIVALSCALIAAVIAVFFIVPLGLSVQSAFTSKNGGLTLAHFEKSFELYTSDMLFTLGIVALACALIAAVAIAIAGYLTLGEHPATKAALRWLYRWPLFIPFVVAGQIMRTFLAKNGMLNHVLVGTGLIEPLAAQSLLDWRGIVIAFVWKQAPFVTLLLAGAMASLDATHVEAARNLGAPRWRVLFGIVLPQVRGTLLVGLVLSFVTMLSVLSVPLMINPNSPTMMTVDVAYRISTHGDYAVANALCLVSLLFASLGAWIYLRHAVSRAEEQTR